MNIVAPGQRERLANTCVSDCIEELEGCNDETLNRINQAELSQPLTTALQIALFRHLDRLGIRPAAIVGHSSGEIAAAHAAGLLTLEEAIVVAYHYGRAASKSAANGTMAAVGLGVDDIMPFLYESVVVACENSSSNTTIAGQKDAVEQTLAAVKHAKPDVNTSRLRVDVAYHSGELVTSFF